jgi:hypothetical protein
MERLTKKNQAIVGKWFHSVNENLDSIKWQGKVLSRPKNGVYIVRIFSWMIEGDYEEKEIKTECMANWFFFSTESEMICHTEP